METEQQLSDAVRAGERAAMKRLYERYLGYAMSIALRYIPDRDDAEDVVQDSFVKVLTAFDGFEFRGEGSLSSWVARIVANKSLDFVRRHERLTFVSELPETVEEEPPVERIPPDVLTAMIARLPSGYRMVLNLYVFEHLTHREIASQLGIRERSSASQLSRARQLLARMMNDYIKRERI